MKTPNIKHRMPQKRKIGKQPMSQKKILMYGVGGGLVLGLGYLAYSYFKNKAANSRAAEPILPKEVSPIIPTPIFSGFPLQSGSRGTMVTMVQQALLNKGGQPALIIKETSFKNGKPDGVFGKGTERALRAAGFPSVLTQTIFTNLVGNSGKDTAIEAGAIAKELISSANRQNLFGVLSNLQKITSVSQYQQVSTYFQNVRILGTRVTSLVNALLSVAFKRKELEKVKIRAEFRRMGLQQNAKGVWFVPTMGYLGAFDAQSNQIAHQWNLAVVEKPTLLKAEDGSFIVPELQQGTVVGYITGMENGVTRILTQSGETVYAPTQNLSSL